MDFSLVNIWLKISAILVSTLLFLPGCANVKQNPIVTHSEPIYIVVEPSSALLLPTKKAAPPDQKTYLDLDESKISDWRIREKLLSDAYINQTSAVNQCNADKASIRDYVAKVKKNYEQKRE